MKTVIKLWLKQSQVLKRMKRWIIGTSTFKRRHHDDFLMDRKHAYSKEMKKTRIQELNKSKNKPKNGGIIMKKTYKLLTSILLTLAVFTGIPAMAADKNIVEIASENEDFSTLVAALTKAELVSDLEGEGPFTVFAPTNAAFEKLLTDLDITAEELLAHPQLKEVLLYHVVSGKVLSTDLKDGMMAATLQGEEIAVDLSDGVKINKSSVVTPDLDASNGVIHVIDTVLVPKSFKLETTETPDMPETVVDIALSSDDFSMLVALLQKAELVDTLKGDGPFTVFAPTNAAFEKLLKDLDITEAELIAQPDLSKVLLYHVISGQVLSSDLTDGLEADTINGEALTFDLMDGVKVNMANVVTADLKANNGVVHVIDAVLVPKDFTYSEVEDSEEIPKTGDVGMVPFAVAGIISLVGAGLLKRKYS